MSKKFALGISVAALLTGVLLNTPVIAASKNVVKGEIVSFDPDNNKLVVRETDGNKEITFTTSNSTAVLGIGTSSRQYDVSMLVGRQGADVVVKFKENGSGKDATLVRVKN